MMEGNTSTAIIFLLAHLTSTDCANAKHAQIAAPFQHTDKSNRRFQNARSTQAGA